MTEDEFWNGLPFLTVIYREKYRLERENRNYQMWLQGLYIYEGFSIALSNVFRKKGQKPKDYPVEPHRITDLDDREAEKAKEETVENFRNQLNFLAKKFKRKQGGENLDSRES